MPVGALNEGIQKLARDSVDALVPLIMQRVYADGAWLPTLTTAGGSVTHASRIGTYTRVGGQVWFNARITLSAISSPTGNVTITGLPLVAAQRGGAWLIDMDGVTLSASYNFLSAVTVAGTSTITLRQQGSAVPGLTLPGTALSATTAIEIAGMYYASDVPAISLEASILSFGPIAYWKLDEVSGAVATDASGNARHGAYTNSPVLGGTFGPFVAPTFATATTQHVNVHSASLAGAFDGNTGSMIAFMRPAGVVGTGRAAYIRTTDANGELTQLHQSGSLASVGRTDTNAGLNDSADVLSANNWAMLGLSWSVGADQLIGYVKGAPLTTQSGLTAWAAPLSSTRCVIGGIATTGTASRWAGQIAHVALFSTVLSAANIAAIYAASGL